MIIFQYVLVLDSITDPLLSPVLSQYVAMLKHTSAAHFAVFSDNSDTFTSGNVL